MGLVNKLFGSYSEREIKAIWPIVHRIEAMEEEYKALPWGAVWEEYCRVCGVRGSDWYEEVEAYEAEVLSMRG